MENHCLQFIRTMSCRYEMYTFSVFSWCLFMKAIPRVLMSCVTHSIYSVFWSLRVSFWVASMGYNLFRTCAGVFLIMQTSINLPLRLKLFLHVSNKICDHQKLCNLWTDLAISLLCISLLVQLHNSWSPNSSNFYLHVVMLGFITRRQMLIYAIFLKLVIKCLGFCLQQWYCRCFEVEILVVLRFKPPILLGWIIVCLCTSFMDSVSKTSLLEVLAVASCRKTRN